MGEINTVLFDFDGTIMDTNEVIIESWQHTYRQLRGTQGDRETILRTFGEPLVDSMRQAFPEVPEEQSVSIYRDFQRSHFLDCIHLFDGVREMLDTLQLRGFRMALVTSRLKYTTMQAMEAFDLGKYFESIVTADDVSRHKPDPQSIEIVLERMQVQPGAAIMIGDSIYDILCARRAHVASVLVSWSMTLAGWDMQDFPPEQAPDHIIRTPGALLELL